MELYNKQDGQRYAVSTEEDGRGGFMIVARPTNPRKPDIHTFCMHYRSVAEFCEEWEDTD